MPRIIPEPRYFSMPSIEVGAEVRMKRALNCWPWVWSLTHSPDAVIHSPAEIVAAWPMTVTRSRWPRAFARRTQKPFSLLWKVTRSTKPASTSWVDDSGCGFICVGAVGASPTASRTTPAPALRGVLLMLAVIFLVSGDTERVRYRRPVHPGDVVEIQARLLRLRGRMGLLTGAARVDGKVAMD